MFREGSLCCVSCVLVSAQQTIAAIGLIGAGWDIEGFGGDSSLRLGGQPQSFPASCPNTQMYITLQWHKRFALVIL